ncbi:GNAT family N-acetyltransferase [Roseibium sp.]|uniref:GNAT family N-acetyltransferase n=1 Tax=Roseibium sp. TaxID=1936156 RepID=UPI003A97EABA
MSAEIDASTLTVRSVEPADEAVVKALVTAAFNQETEARLVHTLRHCGALVLEQVAVTPEGKVVGHVAYSRVTPAGVGPGQDLSIVCLAPVSVWPELQRQGIGSALIRASLDTMKEKGEDLVLVLGHPTYYPRFGFDAELAKKVQAPYAGAAFMACALTEAGERDLPVEVAFATPFQEFE